LRCRSPRPVRRPGGGAQSEPDEPRQQQPEPAYRLLLDDLRREQADERALLRSVLDKLPDEHTMRAIELR
jgi:hypothetical protein